MVQIDCGNVSALRYGDCEEGDVEEDGSAGAADDDPAVEGAVGYAEEEQSHAEFEEALVEEVHCDAEDAELR